MCSSCNYPKVLPLMLSSHRSLLAKRQLEVGGQAAKLRGGLAKLTEARTAVSGLAEACKAQQAVVAESKAACEILLVQIVQDKRHADERERRVRQKHANF